MTNGGTGTHGPASGRPASGASPGDQGGLRRSHALLSLAKLLDGAPPLQVLDLGGLNQQNLDFVTGGGHRLFAEDLVLNYQTAFTPQERLRGDVDPEKLERFLRDCLPFPDAALGAVLAWDRLQFLFPAAASALVDRLCRLMAPGALLLALFHPENLASAAPLTCRIFTGGAIQAAPRPSVLPVEPFNARAIERTFASFAGVKFYMTRDSLQEVLIRR
ncbi:MAG: hypothetical protein C0504_15360 [Candidatus Solibacter sp.]|nr:hypothetical protein [Candidatus Solibacter sp.]